RHVISKILAENLGIEEAFVALEGQHARSFPAIKPALCVDRVYFRGMKVQEVACLQGKPWRMLSDHLPLYARFELL
ncbi:endonuclease/exonuclease/phosphatase family protein, partial [Legionella pneumophila]